MPSPPTASGLLKIAGAAAQSVPGVPAAVEALQFIIERVELVRENKDQQRTFYAEVARIEQILKDVTTQTKEHIANYQTDEQRKEALLRRLDESDRLKKGKQDLESAIEDMKSQAQRLKSGKGLLGLFKGFLYASRNADILASMISSLHTAVRYFQLYSTIVVAAMVQESNEYLHESEARRVVDSIPWANASYHALAELKSGFLKDTREALFKEIFAWMDGELPEGRPKPVYLLTGGVGLGKSSIAHQLCDRVVAREDPTLVLGASFFFTRGGGPLESARLFFSTLARQLTVSRRDLRPAIVKAALSYTQHGDEQQMKYSYGQLFRQPLLDAPPLDPPIRTLLVVDAVDECRDQELVPPLLEDLLALVREVPELYIFLTARPERHILKALVSDDAVDTVHHREVGDLHQESCEDVKRYLEDEIRKIPAYDAYFKSHQDMFDRLLEHTGDMFALARTVVNYLKDNTNRPDEQVAYILSGTGSTVMKLDELYLHVLRSAQPPDRISPGQRDRLQAFLRFLALANEPMTPCTMAFLDARLAGAGDVDDLVQRLRSVLKRLSATGAVVPLHDSFLQFLVDPRRCTDPTYCVRAPAGHALLAAACLGAVTFANVTARLAAYRTPDRVPHHRALRYTLVGGLLHHLRHATADGALAEQLAGFVGGAQAAMYLWVMGDATLLFRHLWRCLEHASTREATCAELLKFSAYVKRWRSRRPTELYEVPPPLSVDELSTYLRTTYHSDAVVAGLGLSVSDEDLLRFQAVMVRLEEDIRGDDRGQTVWFDQPAVNDVAHLYW